MSANRAATYADILGRIERCTEDLRAALTVVQVEAPRLVELLTELAIVMATHDYANVQMVLSGEQSLNTRRDRDLHALATRIERIERCLGMED